MSKAVCVCEQKAQLQYNSQAMQQSAQHDYDDYDVYMKCRHDRGLDC